jgi:tRNA (cmo5U34)-methyltransferase
MCDSDNVFAIKCNFNNNADNYSDDSRRRRIPCFDEFYQTGAAVLSCDKASPRVLDIGAGTGLYSAYLLKRYPNAELTLIDLSEEMLSLARERFAGRPNTRYLIGDYTEYSFDETFDIVISALSLQFVHPEHIAKVFERINKFLSPNGEFLNADRVVSPDPVLQGLHGAAWFDFVKANGATEEDMLRIKRSYALVEPSTVNEQLTWLRKAGFSACDCVFLYRNFAVMYGRKDGCVT